MGAAAAQRRSLRVIWVLIITQARKAASTGRITSEPQYPGIPSAQKISPLSSPRLTSPSSAHLGVAHAGVQGQSERGVDRGRSRRFRRREHGRLLFGRKHLGDLILNLHLEGFLAAQAEASGKPTSSLMAFGACLFAEALRLPFRYGPLSHVPGHEPTGAARRAAARTRRTWRPYGATCTPRGTPRPLELL